MANAENPQFSTMGKLTVGAPPDFTLQQQLMTRDFAVSAKGWKMVQEAELHLGIISNSGIIFPNEYQDYKIAWKNRPEDAHMILVTNNYTNGIDGTYRMGYKSGEK